MNLAEKTSQVQRHPLSKLIGIESGIASITGLPGVIPSFHINNNGENYVILIKPEGPEKLNYNIPKEANSFLTMEHGEETVLLYSLPTKTSVSALRIICFSNFISIFFIVHSICSKYKK